MELTGQMGVAADFVAAAGAGGRAEVIVVVEVFESALPGHSVEGIVGLHEAETVQIVMDT